MGPRRVAPRTQKRWRPEGWGREGWDSERWGPEGVGPRRWGPKGGAPKGGGPKFGAFFLSRPPFPRQPENSKRAHLRVPALQTPPKFHEKTPKERERERKKKNENGGRERENQKRIFFGRSGGGRSSERAVRTTQTTPPHTNWIFTPRESGPRTTQQHTPTHTQTNTATHTNTHTHTLQ